MFKLIKISLVCLFLILQASLSASDRAYADHLFGTSQYPAAILEYQRFLWDGACDDADTLWARHQIIRACYKGGMYRQMRDYISMPGMMQDDAAFCRKFISLTAIREGQYGFAAAMNSESSDAYEMLVQGMALLYLNRVKEAQTIFEALPERQSESFIFDKKELLALQAKLKNQAKRSTVLAGTLALIPGAGYAYNGMWQTAFSSLLLNAAFAGSAYELQKNDLPISSAVVTLIGLGYYIGNIYGSVSMAMKENQTRRERFLNENLNHYFEYLENED